MASQKFSATPPLIHQQLSLLINQLCAVTGIWPVTIEFGILTLVIGYISDEAGSEIVAQILESEAAILRCTEPSVPPEMTKHHHAPIDQLLQSHMLKAAAVKGSA